MKNQTEIKQLLFFAATAAWDADYVLRGGLSEQRSTRVELHKTATSVQAWLGNGDLKIGVLKTGKAFATIFADVDSVWVDVIKKEVNGEGCVEACWVQNGKELGRLTMTATEHQDLPKKYRGQIKRHGIFTRWVRATKIPKDSEFLKLAV